MVRLWRFDVLDRNDLGMRYGAVLAAMERQAQRDMEAAAATAMRLTRTLVLDKPGARQAAAKDIADAEREARVWAELC